MGKRRDGARLKQHFRELDISAANGRTRALADVLARIDAHAPTVEPDAKPDVITGALRSPPSPLAELSALLGVEVLGAEGIGYRDGRPVHWRLTFSGASVPAAEMPTKWLRSSFWLNSMAAYWGRAPGASQLVKADCRRAIRLLHEHVESSTTTHRTESEK